MHQQHLQGLGMNPPNGLHIIPFLIIILYPVCGLCVLRETSRPRDGPGKSNKNDERAGASVSERASGELETAEDKATRTPTTAFVGTENSRHPRGLQWNQMSGDWASFKALFAFFPLPFPSSQCCVNPAHV